MPGSAAPAVIFKAEAIVGPDQLAHYLGLGRHHGRVADMAYHNSLMVQFWSSLAAGDTRLMTHVLREFPRKPVNTAWATYIRCHDDIGWAVTEQDAEAVGWDGPAHRAFLSAFYTGAFPGSFARGEGFQVNPGTGDQRVSGTFASLAGLEAALEAADPAAITAAIERILLGHALILGWDGIPLLYMGDEIGMLNDRSYLDDPDHAADNRWLHRPKMDWTAAAPAPRSDGRSRAASSWACARSSRPAGARRSCRRRRPCGSSTGSTGASSGSSASIPSAGSSRSTASPTSMSRSIRPPCRNRPAGST